ncbi:MAG: beta-phosphoglucomutase [Planctomycetota bacterium]|nr:MAG: beta-phosphoglucomutase [Planctomycetota bacterium]
MMDLPKSWPEVLGLWPQAESWLLHQEGFDPKQGCHFEGLLSQGSGPLQLRASLEEALPECPQDQQPLRQPGNVTSEVFPDTPSKWGCYLPGVYGNHPLLGQELINLPFFLGLQLQLGTEVFSVTDSQWTEHRRCLDLRDGMLYRRFTWKTKSGPTIQAFWLRFVDLTKPQLCLQRVYLTSNRRVRMKVHAFLDARVQTNGFDHLNLVELAAPAPAEIRCRLNTNGDDRIEILSSMQGLQGKAKVLPLKSQDRRLQVGFHLTLDPAQEPAAIEKRSEVRRLFGSQRWRKETKSLWRRPWGQVLTEHRRRWRRRWQSCYLEIEGDPKSQLAVRTAGYHLLRSFVPGGEVAIDAKGYAGEAYYGRYFWDTEIFLLPFFLYTDPQKARDLCRFRLNRLAAAKRHAAESGFYGARYPWESDAEGREQCQAWPYNEQEVHVTSAVVYAWAHLAAASDVEEWTESAHGMVECARFWCSRLVWLPDGRAQLKNVLGPDEYSPNAVDNSYTNHLAKFVLRLGARFCLWGGATTEEARQFENAARALPVWRDRQGRRVLQASDFDQYEPLDFTAVWKDREKTLAEQFPLEELYRHQVLKQADVLMLMALFPRDFNRKEMLAAWNAYEPITSHDSSLSAGVHAWVAARLNLQQPAWQYWQRAAGLDLHPGTASEGIHIANAASLWAILWFGFAGLQSSLFSDTLRLDPKFPSIWHRVNLPLLWRGQKLQLLWQSDRLSVQHHGETALAIEVQGQTWRLQPGETAVIEPERPNRASPKAWLKAVLFDLDGVLVATDHYHFQAWQAIAEELEIPFDWEWNHRLRGVSRRQSLEQLLQAGGKSLSESQMQLFMEKKNRLYRQFLNRLMPGDRLSGVAALLQELRDRGVKLAVVSASRNAAEILQRTGLAAEVDLLVDGSLVQRSKPDPEGFLLAAKRLRTSPAHCLVVEDAPAGILAAERAGMTALAIGDRQLHPNADHLVSDLSRIHAGDLEDLNPVPK